LKIKRRVRIGDVCCKTSDGCRKRIIYRERVVRVVSVEGGVEGDKVSDESWCNNGRYGPVEENGPEGTGLECTEGWVDARKGNGTFGG